MVSNASCIITTISRCFYSWEKKYKIFNCLKPFDDSDRRFYDALMRHLEACQIDPLAIDEETGCYHLAQIAFNALLRLYNAKNNIKASGGSSDVTI